MVSNLTLSDTGRKTVDAAGRFVVVVLFFDRLAGGWVVMNEMERETRDEAFALAAQAAAAARAEGWEGLRVQVVSVFREVEEVL